MIELHVGLIHHPVFNKNKNIVATTITHFDVHDIARVCRSYGVKGYHLIHPAEEQLMFVARLKDHWSLGLGKEMNPLRAEAMKIVNTAKSLNELCVQKGFSKVYATSARIHSDYPLVSFKEFTLMLNQKKQELKTNNLEKILVLFGTGSGLTPEVYKSCDGIIEPIIGFEGSDFRHLSVRSAVAIVLDRLHRA